VLELTRFHTFEDLRIDVLAQIVTCPSRGKNKDGLVSVGEVLARESGFVEE
jgi:hypothetical protein